MARSRLFVAVSVLTAASVAASSVAAAPMLAPVVPAVAATNPAIQKIDRRERDDKRGERRERKRVQWERSYRDSGRGESDRGSVRRERGGSDDRGERDYRGDRRDRDQRGLYGGRDRRDDRRDRDQRGLYGGRDHRDDRRGHAFRGYRLPPGRTVIVRPVPRGPRIAPPPHRRHRYRDVWVYRPYGHWYAGYGHHYHDSDAYPWLAFTAITLGLLGLLTIAQQRAQEQAQIDATTAPVGSTIRWNDANAAGSVSVLRDGRSSDGQYCREFQQTVTVGGRSEQAYGVACRQPDGAWRIVKTH